MIWYVATLIASVISTRGLAAQGELKCSVPSPPLPALSALGSSSALALRLREAPLLSAGEARGWVRRASGDCRGGPGGRGSEELTRKGPELTGYRALEERTLQIEVDFVHLGPLR
jgi:hypothetical protein